MCDLQMDPWWTDPNHEFYKLSILPPLIWTLYLEDEKKKRSKHKSRHRHRH